MFDQKSKLQNEQALMENWDWLTEGIADSNEKLDTSIVLQNSYEMMIKEGQIPEGWLESLLNEEEVLNEAPTLSGAVGSNVIPKVLFPVIRRVMPSLIANQLVSVQPITARTGVIYHIAYQFSDDKGGINSGDEYSANPLTAQQGPGFATYYSSEKIGPFETTVEAATSNTHVETSGRVINFLGTDTAQFSIKRVEIFNITTGRLVSTAFRPFADDAAANAGVDSDDPVGYSIDTGDIFLVDAAETTLWAEGDEFKIWVVYNQEASSKIPEMEFSIGSQTIETTQRKLKVRWTKEAEQDMNAYHKIDVESELVKVASMQMNYEVDRELLKYISDITPTALTKYHDFTADAPTTGNNAQGNYLDRHRALTQKLYLLAAEIAQYNRQGPASWMVVSPQMGAIISMLPNFKGEISGGTFNVFEAGQLGSGMKVFIDPNKAEADEIQLGYKSTNTTYGAGVVYSPYVNWMSNTVVNPDNFNNVRGFFSRYAITEVERGRFFYGKIKVDNVIG